MVVTDGDELREWRCARIYGAKVVIVNLHCGDQNVARPSSFQLTLAATEHAAAPRKRRG
jgi:hypothetical protein